MARSRERAASLLAVSLAHSVLGLWACSVGTRLTATIVISVVIQVVEYFISPTPLERQKLPARCRLGEDDQVTIAQRPRVSRGHTIRRQPACHAGAHANHLIEHVCGGRS